MTNDSLDGPGDLLAADQDLDIWSPVRRIMTPSPVFTAGDVTLRSLAITMTAEGISAVVILGPDGPASVVTERDIVRALADGAEPEAVWADDIATDDVIAADPEDSVASAAQTMVDLGIRHLPVKVNGRVVGMVSARDVLRAVAESVGS